MHADVIAGRQINQTLNEIFKNFMNKYVNPPCNNSSATSFFISTKIMSSSERENEVSRTSAFVDDVVEEGMLEIDEREVEESVSPVPPFVPDLSVAEREGVECVRRVLEQLGSEVVGCTERALEGDDDDGNDSFVDVVGDEQTDEGAVSEGFIFAEALMRANLLPETVLEGGGRCRIIRIAIVLVFTLHPH